MRAIDLQPIAVKPLWNPEPLRLKGNNYTPPRTPPQYDESVSPKHIMFSLADFEDIQAGPYGQSPISSNEKDLPPTPEDDSYTPITPDNTLPLRLNIPFYNPTAVLYRPTTPKLMIPPSRSGPVVEIVQEVKKEGAVIPEVKKQAPQVNRRNSVNDYMSLEQLENMWYAQDKFCLGSFDVPQVPGSPAWLLQRSKMVGNVAAF